MGPERRTAFELLASLILCSWLGIHWTVGNKWNSETLQSYTYTYCKLCGRLRFKEKHKGGLPWIGDKHG